MRRAEIVRETSETRIELTLDLDGTGAAEIATGIGFLDHMLHQIARHAMIDLRVRATGDTHVDDHHTVEDTGLALGDALTRALGDKAGIVRYGACLLPMDDALVRCALDLSGRPYLVWDASPEAKAIGRFDTELSREFFQAVAVRGGITLHLHRLEGINAHHVVEATFKAFARALRQAVEPDPRAGGAVPSTKGSL